jgi:hypothetical protein
MKQYFVILGALCWALGCSSSTSNATGDGAAGDLPVGTDEHFDTVRMDLAPADSISMFNAGGLAGNPIEEVPLDQLPGSPCSEGDKVTFGEVFNIMGSSCAVLGGCHSASDLGATLGQNISSAAANFDLSTAEAAYENLVGDSEASELCGGGARVIPGDPDGSVLIQRLEGDGCGDQMPQGGEPLPEKTLARIREWIADGADPGPKLSECNVSTDPPADAPTFTEVYEKIIKPGCAGVWCHDPYQSPDERRLDTSTKETAYADLVNVNSICAGGGSNMLRVAPGDPENSMLIFKLLGTACGLPMPVDLLGAPVPLSVEELRMVYDWIAAGAPNN